MGEATANIYNRRLLVRLRVPSMDKMVVHLELGREYLKPLLEAHADLRKDQADHEGVGRVTIQNHHGNYVWDLQSGVNSSLGLLGSR